MMFKHGWVLMACVGALVGCQIREDARSTPLDPEFQALQGHWIMVSSICCGEEMPSEMVRKISRQINGNLSIITVEEENGPKQFTGTIHLDAKTQPKSIDISLTSGEAKGNTVLGIYEIKGDQVRMCFSTVGKPRPKEFSSTPGSEQRLVIWKRLPVAK